MQAVPHVRDDKDRLRVAAELRAEQVAAFLYLLKLLPALTAENRIA
jgi:hypothetical protein